MSVEKLVEDLREMQQFYGRVVVDGKFVSEPTRTGKLFSEAIAAIAELRAENERLKAERWDKECAEMLESRSQYYEGVIGRINREKQQLEQRNAELRAALKDLLNLIAARTDDGLTQFCADPKCNCAAAFVYQKAKALNVQG